MDAHEVIDLAVHERFHVVVVGGAGLLDIVEEVVEFVLRDGHADLVAHVVIGVLTVDLQLAETTLAAHQLGEGEAGVGGTTIAAVVHGDDLLGRDGDGLNVFLRALVVGAENAAEEDVIELAGRGAVMLHADLSGGSDGEAKLGSIVLIEHGGLLGLAGEEVTVFPSGFIADGGLEASGDVIHFHLADFLVSLVLAGETGLDISVSFEAAVELLGLALETFLKDGAGGLDGGEFDAHGRMAVGRLGISRW